MMEKEGKRMALNNFKRKTNYPRKYLELVKRKAAVYNAVKERKIMEREKESSFIFQCLLIFNTRIVEAGKQEDIYRGVYC